jgi:sugar lactone lactonase YvrE
VHRINLKDGASEEERPNEPIRSRLFYNPSSTAVGVAYDCHEDFVYWSDVRGNVVNRIRPDGSNFSLVLTNVKSAEGLAIDWLARNLYLADSEARTIEVASLNGKHRKVLIKSQLRNPRGLAVDPVDGYEIEYMCLDLKHR